MVTARGTLGSHGTLSASVIHVWLETIWRRIDNCQGYLCPRYSWTKDENWIEGPRDRKGNLK
jgi:hypothetical protein